MHLFKGLEIFFINKEEFEIQKKTWKKTAKKIEIFYVVCISFFFFTFNCFKFVFKKIEITKIFFIIKPTQIKKKMQPNLLPLETILFFGSLNQETNLLPTPSQYYAYSRSDLVQMQSSQTRLQALVPRFPMDFLGSDYKSLFLPCTPAHEIELKISESQFPICKPENPGVLNLGFIKTEQKTGFKGFRSGKRSAIFWDSNEKKFFRLKGCGNLESGFVCSIGKVNLDPNSKEIRGCHYRHTVKRELLMTEKIDGFLKEFGFESGNKPVGFWLYNEKFEEVVNNLSNVFPKISKFCGVFETLGEKRVATHLFQGFEALLSEILRISEKFQNFKLDLDSVFTEERVLKDGSFIKTPVSLDGNETEENLLNIFEFINEKKLQMPLDTLSKSIFLQFMPEIIENLNITKNYVELFTKIFMNLFNDNDFFFLNDFLGLAGTLYSRIGFEIGRIKTIFCEKRINWGYYFDHHPYLAHCNAHPNNFIVLPEDSIGENLLAPLDFDLAFEEKEFLNIDYSEKSYGDFDGKVFCDFMENEKISMEFALTGMENMDNFEYYGLKLKELEQKTQRNFEGVKILLRDSLRKFYLKGMNLKENFDFEKKFTWKKHKKIYDLIKLALIITNDCLG